MPCAALTNKGGRLYISDGPLINDITALIDATYIPVGGVGSIETNGVDQEVVEHQVFGRDLPIFLKSDADLLEWSVDIVDTRSAGTDAMDTASAPGNHAVYGIRIEWHNGDIELSLNLVKSPVLLKGGSSEIRRLRYTFKPVSEIYRI